MSARAAGVRPGPAEPPGRAPERPDLLFLGRPGPAASGVPEPHYFADLRLDRVVAAVAAGDREYDLVPLYRSPLADPGAVRDRQQVFRDLDRDDLGAVVRRFARRRLVHESGYRTRELREDDGGLQHYYVARFFLNAVEDYCTAVTDLYAGLREGAPRSAGLIAVTERLSEYVRSTEFTDLRTETQRLEEALGAVRYVIALRGDRITVAPYDGEPDYGEQVAHTFARFHQRETPPATRRYDDWETYAGTGVLDLVARLHPELFAELDAFCARRRNYLDPLIAALDHDVRFYLAYLDHIAPLRDAGLPFGYPRVSTTDKTEQALDTFDLALAHAVHGADPGDAGRGADAAAGPDGSRAGGIVTNDLTLTGSERILVVSGPNNGGKTTLARTVGQLHHLARLGCPVPGRELRLFLCDRIFTHFDRTEDSRTLTGRLQAELERLRDDLAGATPASLVILNEVFSSTTAADALTLSREILRRVSDLDALGVCVTFLDELADTDGRTVGMVAQVAADDPARRTFRVTRGHSDGRAYARAIADKYGLGFDQLSEELRR